MKTADNTLSGRIACIALVIILALSGVFMTSCTDKEEKAGSNDTEDSVRAAAAGADRKIIPKSMKSGPPAKPVVCSAPIRRWYQHALASA